jgi:hypothetical protein
MPVTRRVLSRKHPVTRRAGIELTKGRQADADDTEEDFEDGPICRGDIVICWVGRAEIDDTSETDYRNDCCPVDY